MNTDEDMYQLTDGTWRKRLAPAAERSYCGYLKVLPFHLPIEQKLERSLTALAKKFVASSTQNQAINAIFFYKEALGVELKNVQALRARWPARIRHAPTPTETEKWVKAFWF
jgi:hypothetical protein